ncbi:TPM domain-containing protein [Bacteroidota bacterium]
MAANFFTTEEKFQITKAIKEAELNTSGEIRVHIEGSTKDNVLDRASFIFKKLNIHKTQLRNGVLFYIAIKDKNFAILGDGGINAIVPENFWEEIKNSMQMSFKEGKFAEGLINGILKSGEQLKTHFPYQKDDVNELSDDISFGEN